jgi:DNA repair photolyase
LRRYVKYVYRRGLRPIPFRLSTLADSFTPHEELYRFSEYVLKVALNYGQPLTKY